MPAYSWATLNTAYWSPLQALYQNCTRVPLYKRYTDDGCVELRRSVSVLDFIRFVQNFHTSIKFTYKISYVSVEFLDILVKIKHTASSLQLFSTNLLMLTPTCISTRLFTLTQKQAFQIYGVISYGSGWRGGGGCRKPVLGVWSKACPHVCADTSVRGPNGHTSIKRTFTCQRDNLVYAITCRSCNLSCGGEASRPLAVRFSEHLADIRHSRSRPVAHHFGPTIADVRVQALWQLPGDSCQPKHMESHNIHVPRWAE